MDYSASIETTANAAQAALAIQHEMDKWWSLRVEQNDRQVTIRFRNSHVTFAFDPDGTENRFTWSCIDARMIIEDVGDHGEWKGTKLLWDITPTASGCRVTLTHQGLNPDLECHRVCVAGWGHYFENSLKNHLNGAPPTPETN